MKNILLLLLLFYCNSFDLIGLSSINNSFFNSNSFSFFNIISQTTAQSVSKVHQQQICHKLRIADFNNDGLIDGADYSIIYLVAMRDQNTIESVQKNPNMFALMDLSLDLTNRSIASVESDLDENKAIVDEHDVVIFYNFLTDKIPYCPYKIP